nr:hypothetical protein [uncultured Flavobacterium sp.]
MKTFRRTKILAIALGALFAFSLTNCVVRHTHHRTVVKEKRIPPGHAKKMSGDQSARRHAPGHNK